MNELLAPFRKLIASRSPRERWLLTAAGCLGLFVFVYFALVKPIEGVGNATSGDVERLQVDVTRALRLASEMRGLQGELAAVEQRIQPGAQTNLIALLSTLAAEAQIGQQQLESIEPRQPSTNPRYPETRAEVRLRGATLAQAVSFLHKIETSSSHLIVRSLKIRSRGEDEGTPQLDVSFSVSSFERAT